MSNTQVPSSAIEMNREQLDQLKALESMKAGVREQLVALFETNTRKRMAELRAGLHTGDREALRRAAHALKGVSASLGAAGLSALAADLEIACAPSASTDMPADAMQQVQAIDAAIDASQTYLDHWLGLPGGA